MVDVSSNLVGSRCRWSFWSQLPISARAFSLLQAIYDKIISIIFNIYFYFFFLKHYFMTICLRIAIVHRWHKLLAAPDNFSHYGMPLWIQMTRNGSESSIRLKLVPRFLACNPQAMSVWVWYFNKKSCSVTISDMLLVCSVAAFMGSKLQTPWRRLWSFRPRVAIGYTWLYYISLFRSWILFHKYRYITNRLLVSVQVQSHGDMV